MLQGYRHLLEKEGPGPDLLCGCADLPADLCKQVQGFSAEAPDVSTTTGTKCPAKDLILAPLSQLRQSCDSSSLYYSLCQVGCGESVCAGNVPDEHSD